MSGLESPPVGGSTGLSHEHSAAFDEALLFLLNAQPHDLPCPLIGGLEERFGLTVVEALEVHEAARRLKRVEL